MTFTLENTSGYTAAEIRRANALFVAEHDARELNPDDLHYKSQCDALADDVLFTLEQVGPCDECERSYGPHYSGECEHV